MSRTKLGGLGLVSAGVLATLMGFVALGQQNSSAPAAAPQPGPATQATAPAAPDTPEHISSAAPPPAPVPSAAPPPAAPAPAAPPTAAPPPPAPPVGQPIPGVQPREIVRVYNNSTIGGLAHRAANDLSLAGFQVGEVGNYAAGRIQTTTVYYRPGSGEHPEALAIAREFGARIEPRFAGLEQASPGVIVVVTNDYKGPIGKQGK